MNTSRLALACGLALALLSPAVSATERFVSLTGGHAPPFINWADAATNIQAAIDAASADDLIWVTNGVYSTGGKVKAGDLTNRVALDKALIVQSVNGSVVTIIQGQFDAVSTNGPGAVRCVWLTNGATLSGFTLRGGATRSSGDAATLQSGGGAWCAATNALVINCIISSNAAASAGGAVYAGTVKNSTLSGNRAGSTGGGAANSWLNNCAVTGNSSGSQAGGTSSCRLNNCTLTGNIAAGNAGGSAYDSATNCIVYSNSTSPIGSSYPNYMFSSFRYTCTSPLPSGTGNTSVPPGLLADGVHLSELSPCRGAGNAASVSGTDIDGQTWANPPSMGCDEVGVNPVMYGQPRPRPATVSGQVRITTLVTGQQPLVCFWSKDGVPLVDGAEYGDANTPSLAVKAFGLDDAGAYQVVVSNAFGMVTSQVSQVAIHCVDAAAAVPLSPYSTWGSAAATIQEAIETAAAGDVILVTNGIYASGGKAMYSSGLTNRVVVDKAVLVTSVNGREVTTIRGQLNPFFKYGPGTIRCVWMGGGSGLSSFTLMDGANQGIATSELANGGGVLCASTNEYVANCIITNCYSAAEGGGAYLGTLNNCILVGNAALLGGVGNGGGASSSVLNNCQIINNSAKTGGGGATFALIYNSLLAGNSAGNSGGGARGGTLINCTLTGNSAAFRGGGSDIAALTNCIVFFNTAPNFGNIAAGSASFSCSTPLPSGPGNISSDPQFTDGVHLAITSPCRGTGSPLYTSGTDVDGELWSNPPSMGCDEVLESALIGTLSVGLTVGYPEVPAYGVLPLTGQVIGRASRLEWSFGDGPISTNLSYLTSHTWTNAGDYTVSFTAFNSDNPGGVSTNLLMHVVPLASPQLIVGGLNGNNFSLSFPGQAGVTYVVEQSTNLVPPVTWQTVQTLSSTGALMQVTDTKATNAMRFYRARTQ